MDYSQIAIELVDLVGGKENITSVTHCVTRLRLHLKDTTLYDKVGLEGLPEAKGVLFSNGQLQVVFGGAVEHVYNAVINTLESDGAYSGTSDTTSNQQEEKWTAATIFKAFSDIFVGIIPALVGSAMVLGLRSLFITAGIFGMSEPLAANYKWAADIAEFLNIVASGLTFLPVLVAYSATKRFGGNPVLGIILGLILVHPELGNRFEYLQGTITDLRYWDMYMFDWQIPVVAFQGGIFPAIMAAFFLSQFERFITKNTPQVLSFILVPSLTLIVTSVLLFTVFGPLGDLISSAIGFVSELLYMRAGVFGAFVFAAALQPLVITGTHHAIGSIEALLVSTTGFNYIQALWSVSIIAQGGACIGVYMLARKQRKLREVAFSSFIPTLVGVSEPAIFAVNLKESAIPFICATIGAGFGGVYMKIMDVKALGFGLTGLPGISIVFPPVMIHYIIGNIIAFIVPIILLVTYHKVKGIPGINK